MKPFGEVTTAAVVPTADPAAHHCELLPLPPPPDLSSTKAAEKPASTPRMALFKHGVDMAQTNPAKAPTEMANAIRRRKQTSDLDYWHTLPSSSGLAPSSVGPLGSGGPALPRPLYRAVIRGTLTADNAVCTLSSIADAATEREYNMVVKRNVVSTTSAGGGGGGHGYFHQLQHGSHQLNLLHKSGHVIRAEDVGLTISGLNLNDVRAKQNQTVPMINSNSTSNSPRYSEIKNYSYNHNHTSTSTSTGGYNNNIINTFSPGNKPKKISGPQKNLKNKGVSNNINSNNSENNNINGDTVLPAGRTIMNNKQSFNPSSTTTAKNNTTHKTARLTLTVRHHNSHNGDQLWDTKKLPVSPRSEYVHRKDVGGSFDLPKSFSPYRSALVRQSSLPITSNESKTTNESINNDQNNTTVISNHNERNIAKRKFSQEIENKKVSNNNNKSNKNNNSLNNGNSASPSTCMQLADSILGAMNGDINQIYSLCHAKVRYAEFIEQSQPHRLGIQQQSLDSRADEKYAQITTNNMTPNQLKYDASTKDYRLNKNHGTNKQHAKDPASSNSLATSSQTSPPSSSSSASSSSPQQPSSPTNLTPSASAAASSINKSCPPFRLAPLTPRGHKMTSEFKNLPSQNSLGVYNLDGPSHVAWDAEQCYPTTRGKATRPILKSSKTDMDTTPSHFRNKTDRTDSNNNSTGMGGGHRLVRFNVNHEVREFAPSEPIILS